MTAFAIIPTTRLQILYSRATLEAVTLTGYRTVMLAKTEDAADIDSVWLDIENLGGLALEASDAVASGFLAKACIHPAHAPIMRDA